jgi:hypothetical protein
MVHRFRTRHRCHDLRIGRMSRLRKDRGLCCPAPRISSAALTSRVARLAVRSDARQVLAEYTRYLQREPAALVAGTRTSAARARPGDRYNRRITRRQVVHGLAMSTTERPSGRIKTTAQGPVAEFWHGTGRPGSEHPEIASPTSGVAHTASSSRSLLRPGGARHGARPDQAAAPAGQCAGSWGRLGDPAR